MSATESQSGLTTVFVDAKATKRRLKKAKLTVLDGPSKGQELEIDKMKQEEGFGNGAVV